MRNTIALLGLSLATCLTLPASTLIYNFSSPSGNLGSSDHTYTSNGLSLPAYGFSSSSPLSLGTGVNLFGKTDGAHETGLGLVNDLSGDHEIVPGSYIQLDLSGLTHATGFGIQVLSVQQGEGYNLYLSNAKGVAGAAYQTGISSESAYSVPVADFQTTPFLLSVRRPEMCCLVRSQPRPKPRNRPPCSRWEWVSWPWPSLFAASSPCDLWPWPPNETIPHNACVAKCLLGSYLL